MITTTLSLCRRQSAHFFVTPIYKKSQPAIKKIPPNGVAIPTSVRWVFSAIFNAVRAYSEPEKRMIPVIKQLPAQTIHLFEIFSDNRATKSRAKT